MEAQAAVATAILPRNPLSRVDPVPSLVVYVDKEIFTRAPPTASVYFPNHIELSGNYPS